MANSNILGTCDHGETALIHLEHVGDVAVVRFMDHTIMDEQTCQAIGDQLLGLVDESGRTKLLLNFENVERMSSAALSKLITLNKKIKGADGRLVLCSIDPKVREAFKVTYLDKLITICGDEQEALQQFLKP